jgi:hypothetical protein
MDAALLSDKKISSLFQVIERFREEYPEMPAQRNERKVRRRIELTTTGKSPAGHNAPGGKSVRRSVERF